MVGNRLMSAGVWVGRKPLADTRGEECVPAKPAGNEGQPPCQVHRNRGKPHRPTHQKALQYTLATAWTADPVHDTQVWVGVAVPRAGWAERLRHHPQGGPHDVRAAEGGGGGCRDDGLCRVRTEGVAEEPKHLRAVDVTENGGEGPDPTLCWKETPAQSKPAPEKYFQFDKKA